MTIFLCIDIGTSSLKAALIDGDGRELAYARSMYEGLPGPAAWERAFDAALEGIFGRRANGQRAPGSARIGISRGSGISCVCISGNGPTLAALDGQGTPIALLPWSGPSRRPPGTEGAPSFFLPLVRYYKEEFPGEYARTSRFLSPQEYLSWRLGAPPFTCLPNAAFGPFYWDENQCRLFHLDPCRFAPFAPLGSIVGQVGDTCRPLLSGTPIAACGPDFLMALIGTGVLEPGMVCDRAGSSEGINLCFSGDPALLQGRPFRVLPHVREGFWNIGAVIPESGKLFEDYRRETGGRDYGELLEDLIPCTWESGVGNRESVSYQKGREVLRGMAGAVRAKAVDFAEAGFPIGEMRVSGGQGKNRLWNRYKAELTGIRLLIPEIEDGELAGDAVLGSLALKGLGMEALPEEARRIVRIRETFEPG